MVSATHRERVERRAARLRDRFGEFEVGEETFEVTREKFERKRAAAERDALGGGRVLLTCGGETLLVKNRDEGGVWDVPGGAREPGETLAETARREVREETGIDCTLVELRQVIRFGFVPEGGDGAVSDLWAHFAGECERRTPSVQAEELLDARWFASPPPNLDRYVAPVVREWAAERADE